MYVQLFTYIYHFLTQQHFKTRLVYSVALFVFLDMQEKKLSE